MVDAPGIFDFKYSCKLESASSPHQINFSFNPQSQLPNRLIALIGRNGTGKTQVLSRFALSLSGQDSDENFRNAFEPRRPLFSRVLAVSYSLFDSFKKPSSNLSNNYNSYKYIGIRNTRNGIKNDKELSEQLQNSIQLIKEQNRVANWRNSLTGIIDDLGYIETKFFIDADFSLFSSNQNNFLSSGQSILIFVFTEIIANIDRDTLLLIDEPETHLHPNAIAKFIRVFYKLLEEFDSYAVIATHSPIIVQEVPSKYVKIFDRIGNNPVIRELGIESFGENFSIITEKIFETSEIKDTYKEVLEMLAKKLNFEQVIELFPNGLSLNAKIYLKGLYNRG